MMKKTDILKGTHYEAEVSFFYQDDTLLVKKRYRQDVACIQWLNKHLAKYYDPSRVMPVAQHEYAALNLLSRYDMAPKPLSLESDFIIMHFCGTPFTLQYTLPKAAYLKQCHLLLDSLEKLGFAHNDLLPSNLLIDKEKKIRVIDFTLSEFDGIRIMDELPDQSWARPYQDREILRQYRRKSRMEKMMKRIIHGSFFK